MIAPTQIAQQLVEWTDPSKLVPMENTTVDELAHFDLAIDLLKELYKRPSSLPVSIL